MLVYGKKLWKKDVHRARRNSSRQEIIYCLNLFSFSVLCISDIKTYFIHTSFFSSELLLVQG